MSEPNAPGDDGMELLEAFEIVLRLAEGNKVLSPGAIHSEEAIKLIRALAVGTYGMKG